MPEVSLVQVLIQGGPSGALLVALYIIYKMSNGKLKIMMDVLRENTAANTKLGDGIEHLIELVRTKL